MVVCNNKHKVVLKKKHKLLDHILSSRIVASMVWKKAASIMRAYNVEIKPLKIKIHRWFCDVKKSNLKGMLMGLFLVIISWRLWIQRCKAPMEDKMDPREMVWLLARVGF